ncbi:MAG: hypothetical protein FWF49_01640 [Oscillospiraceae bacterium]|nr:hypothetical protein [Oscillospiraceae bacterium]
MRVWSMILLLVIGLTLFPGFRAKTGAGDQLVVTALGIDIQDGAVRAVVSTIDVAVEGGEEVPENTVRTGTGASLSAALADIEQQSGRTSYLLHNKTLVLSLAAAQGEPLGVLLERLTVDSELRPGVKIALCRGDVEEALNTSIGVPYLRFARQPDGWLPIVEGGAALFKNGVYAGELSDDAARGAALVDGLQSPLIYVTAAGTQRVSASRTRIAAGTEGYTLSLTLTAKVEEGGADGLDEAARQDVAAAVTESAATGVDIWGLHTLTQKQDAAFARTVDADFGGWLQRTAFTIEIKINYISGRE